MSRIAAFSALLAVALVSSAVSDEVAKRPINLARTNLAVVSATSVNGNRGLSNIFYGIRNAFDGGENWHNEINYTYWLSHPGASQAIEISFDHPMTVTGLEMEGGSQCTATLRCKGGGEETQGRFEDSLKFPRKIKDVVGLTLKFSTEDGSVVRVDEIKVMGQPPKDIEVKTQTPRLLAELTPADAIAIAEDAFEATGMTTRAKVVANVAETETAMIVTFTHREDEVDLLSVTIDRKTQTPEVRKLAKWAPLE